MAQTALQELIEYAKNSADYILDTDDERDRYARMAYKDVIAKAQSLLLKERQIIEKAYNSGYGAPDTGSDYFTQNFNPIN